MGNRCPLVWVIMGVAGSGKTVVGRRLAERLDSDFLEGDRRHPEENIQKMRSQQPLTEQDRHTWLLALEDDMRRAIAQKRETVLTCSALKAAHRQQLVSIGRVQLVWLNVPAAELKKRLQQRCNHYMKSDMLTSQLEAFEPLTPEEQVITLDGRLVPAKIVEELLSQATWLYPDLEKSWWQRTL